MEVEIEPRRVEAQNAAARDRGPELRLAGGAMMVNDQAPPGSRPADNVRCS
jgi:hypothetical protein